MFINGNVCMYYTSVEPISSGSRIFRKEDNIVDINELHKSLLDTDNFVVLINDVSKYSEATEKQYFIVTDKLANEEGYEDTFVFSHFGRGNGITNRKIVMSFSEISETPSLKATYYNS